MQHTALRSTVAALLSVFGAASAQAQAPTPAPLQLSIEGGSACSRGNRGVTPFGADLLGRKGCGWTGTVELARTGASVLSVFDHWAIRGRLTSFDDTRTGAKFEDERVVVDAEVGRKIDLFGGLMSGIFPGSVSRLTLGLRYADWEGTSTIAGVGVTTFTTQGLGPRVGMRSFVPLGQSFALESRSGVSALFAGSSDMVYSIDTSTALTYLLRGDASGPALSVGYSSEYWFKQFDTVGTGSHTRHSSGPFARVRVPLQ